LRSFGAKREADPVGTLGGEGPATEVPGPDHPYLRATVALSAGARAAGAVLALGFLLGVVQGSVVAVVGGLALVTCGRSLLVRDADAILSVAGLVTVGGASGRAPCSTGNRSGGRAEHLRDLDLGRLGVASRRFPGGGARVRVVHRGRRGAREPIS
jgi:hypothetical protein